MEEVTVHVHNGIDYSVNSEGRCDWHACTHNVYNSFDEPEEVKVVRRITLNADDMGCEHGINSRVTCGTCQRNWCEVCTPTPAARCPYEYEHTDDEYAEIENARIQAAINLLEDAGFTVIKDDETDE